MTPPRRYLALKIKGEQSFDQRRRPGFEKQTHLLTHHSSSGSDERLLALKSLTFFIPNFRSSEALPPSMNEIEQYDYESSFR